MTKTVFKLLIQTETLEPARQDKDQMEITCSREKEVILEESGGKQYHSHAATIYKWAQEDAAKEKPKKGIPDYSFKEGESL